MPAFPPAFKRRMISQLGHDFKAFKNVHGVPALTSIRLNPKKPVNQSSLPINTKVPWCHNAYYLKTRPSFTLDPFFHAGQYYVQEASSMILDKVVRQLGILSQECKALDLCAAPGGKSTLLLSLMNDEGLLVSNEVIRSRAFMLRDNITKWGYANAIVTQNDPAKFSNLKSYFDLILVDAPCSGEGLFRKDPSSMDQWSEENVRVCSLRQKRILANAIPALNNSGYLIYSTCTYNEHENDQQVKWLMESFDLETVHIELSPEWGISYNGLSYKCYPNKVEGEGFAFSIFKKKGLKKRIKRKRIKKLKGPGKNDLEKLNKWYQMKLDQIVVHKSKEFVLLPQLLQNEFDTLNNHLNIIYAGCPLGSFKRSEYIPTHAALMNPDIQQKCKSVALTISEAQDFLRGHKLDFSTNDRGWHFVSFEQSPLGWIKCLERRVNNYYPKSLRIRHK